jgi:hypothetical protein
MNFNVCVHVNDLNDHAMCHEHGLVQMIATPIHDNNIFDKFFVNRPDLRYNCFTIKNAVKPKHYAVLEGNKYVRCLMTDYD